MRLLYTNASIIAARVLSKLLLFATFRIFRIPSITFNSVEVVSNPQNALQSFAINPAEIISLPRLTVPAASGTYGTKMTNIEF